jgi:Type IV secretion-system coupling protein DNA-binding domain
VHEGTQSRRGHVDGVILGTDVETGEEVILENPERLQGLYIIGAPGTGKTTLLLNLALQDVEQQHGLCFFDPHGDAIDALLQHVPSPHHDAVLVDVGRRDSRFGLNLYEIDDPTDEAAVARQARQVASIFEFVWADASWGPRLEELLSIVSYTLIANPGSTILDVPLLLGDGAESEAFRMRLLQQIQNPEVHEFWRRFEELPMAARAEIRDSLLNRLRNLLSNPVVASILGHDHTTVNFREAMDEGKIILVKLARGTLGDDAVNLLGSAIMGLIGNAAFARGSQSPTSHRPFFVYADEYQHLATHAFVQLLAEGRRYGVVVATAHQNRAQFAYLGPAIARIQAANIAVFQLLGDDSDALAAEFDIVRPSGEHSFTEARVETARMLADLPPYTARVRLVKRGAVVEHTIRIQPFPRSLGSGNP